MPYHQSVKSHARWEIVGILGVVGAVVLARSRLPARAEVGELVLGVAALLLTQGLIRDLVRLRAARALAREGAPKITCVCVESTLGLTAILAGTLLVFAMSPMALRVPTLAWPSGVAFVMGFGFVTRHLVFDWRALSLRWEPDHAGVVVWRK